MRTRIVDRHAVVDPVVYKYILVTYLGAQSRLLVSIESSGVVDLSNPNVWRTIYA